MDDLRSRVAEISRTVTAAQTELIINPHNPSDVTEHVSRAIRLLGDAEVALFRLDIVLTGRAIADDMTSELGLPEGWRVEFTS